MEQDLEKKINEIVEKFACPKGFKCCTEGLENLFSINVHDAYYCECPLRIYIAKKLKK
jgi:hypothetical protein